VPISVTFTAGHLVLPGQLDDSPTASALAARLPLTVRMSRWGDEYYGALRPPLGQPLAPDAREAMIVGELAYWPPGDALCVFFGPTPASEGSEPRAASPVNPIGRLSGPISALKALGAAIQATLDRAQPT
jgi:hypothetical protein